MRTAKLAAALALLAALILESVAFKEGEFKKCGDSGFCKRLRGNKGDAYEVVASSVKVAASELTATLLNTAAAKPLDLKLTAYDGFFRLTVDENPSEQRFQVPFALLDSLPRFVRNWSRPKTARKSATLELGDVTVVLSFQPFSLEVKRGRETLVQLNSRGLFQFEHHRQKQEGDPEGWWEETFKSFTDSKPKGPEAISLDISFPGVQHVYGIPERAKTFSLPPTTGDGIESEPYRLYNLDVFEYLEDSPFGLYGAIPVMTAHRASSTVGVFWLNSAEMVVDVGKTKAGTETQWIAESGIVDLFIFPGPTADEVLQQYARTTGTTQMPQLFALGYHQCRWNYRDEADVRTVDATMDAYDIPYDVIWLDIEHTDGKRYFTWDAAHFPTPLDMQARLAEHGRKLVTIIDPHIKKDPDYYTYKEAEAGHYLTKNKDGNDYDGWCWPGASVYIDMMNPGAVSWWTQQFELSKYRGSTPDLYVWNDMNEPSVFNGPEATMQKDNLHFGGIEHRDLHNLHGLLFHRATALGLQARGGGLAADGDRPFVLTRSFFAGSQRWGPMWTGDNTANWAALRVSIPMLLASGIAGYPWAGADVGGFFGNPDSELYTRFYQLGAYFPFFRGHAHLDTARREPWVFGEPTTSRVKEAIRGRYALLPYIYTLFRQSHELGSAIFRPLWYDFPSEEDLFSVDDEFMLGPALLAAPVLEAGQAQRDVTLPGGAAWYDAESGVLAAGAGAAVTRQSLPVDLDSAPAFWRGGSIVPSRQRPRRNTAAAAKDPYTLLVALDGKKLASGSLYVDDGRSFAHERGKFTKIELSFDGSTLTNRVVSAGFQPELQIERIAILGLAPPATPWAARASPAGAPLEVAWGPLRLKPGMPDAALIIRKPGLAIGEAWSLTLERLKESAQT